jgi:lysozyme
VTTQLIRHGIDVSDDQGAIDWRQAAEGLGMAAVQVGYAARAAWFTTRTGQANVHAALKNGLMVMPYFFAWPVPGQAELQGNQFGNMVRDLEREGAAFDLPLAVDVELNPEGMEPAAMSGWVREFLQATGFDPKRLAVYTDPGFWEANTDGTPINAHLWVAAWGAPKPPRLKGLPEPFCWQTTNRGHVPGIYGPVDLDTLLFVPYQMRDPHDQAPNVQRLPGGTVLWPSGTP